jgi:hypothetical protein
VGVHPQGRFEGVADPGGDLLGLPAGGDQPRDMRVR